MKDRLYAIWEMMLDAEVMDVEFTGRVELVDGPYDPADDQTWIVMREAIQEEFPEATDDPQPNDCS